MKVKKDRQVCPRCGQLLEIRGYVVKRPRITALREKAAARAAEALAEEEAAAIDPPPEPTS